MPRDSRYDLPSVNPTLPELGRMVREIRQGHVNTKGTVTLIGGTTETLIADREFALTTTIHLTPTSEAAAATVPWLKSRAKGSLTLGHADPVTDVVFEYTAQG